MIIYKLHDADRAPALAQHFETLFQHDATSWQEREESTLQLFRRCKFRAAITVRSSSCSPGLRHLQRADHDT